MVRIATNLTKYSLKQIFSGIRFALPWALRLLIFTTGVSIRLSILATVSSYKGIQPVANQIAQDWTFRAILAGFPYLWETRLRSVFYVLAICTIYAGWLIILFTGYITADIAYHLLFHVH